MSTERTRVRRLIVQAMQDHPSVDPSTVHDTRMLPLKKKHDRHFSIYCAGDSRVDEGDEPRHMVFPIQYKRMGEFVVETFAIWEGDDADDAGKTIDDQTQIIEDAMNLLLSGHAAQTVDSIEYKSTEVNYSQDGEAFIVAAVVTYEVTFFTQVGDATLPDYAGADVDYHSHDADGVKPEPPHAEDTANPT
jgi:hypothetical protein